MRLHARWQGSHSSTRPVLVWLHGFLGCGEEWHRIQRYFTGWPQLSLDLPGHGGSSGQRIEGFEALAGAMTETLRAHRVKRYWLIGYSLGGRAALYYACRHKTDALAGLILEGAHPGLACDSERKKRDQHDAEWARRFRQQPLLLTLQQWYCQPVFADLTEDERQALLARRLRNHPASLADMLLATSLSRQPDLLPELQLLNCPVHAVCGERDSKFLQLAQRAMLTSHAIPAAGHNAHRANPQAFAAQLTQILTHR